MKLTAAQRAEFDLHLAAATRVERPGLVDYFMAGGIDGMPIIDTPGKLKNAAWRTLHAESATVYEDESERSRQNGGSQVETLRAYVKRIYSAYRDAFGNEFPQSVALTAGDDDGTVDIWRLS